MLVPSRWITVDCSVNGVVARCPTTAPVFIQFGRLYVDRPREVELNTAAESEEAARLWSPSRHDEPDPAGDFSLALGYTGSHRPAEDSSPGRVPVVLVQATRGPE